MSDESLKRHIEAKRELRKKKLVEKILESESEKKLRLKKEKRKVNKVQSRLIRDIRKIENSHTSLGEMNHNKDTDQS